MTTPLLQVVLGKGLGGPGGLTVTQLLGEGYEAIFLGIGLPEPKINPLFANLTPALGFYTSKDFLPLVAAASKPGTAALQRGHVSCDVM